MFYKTVLGGFFGVLISASLAHAQINQHNNTNLENQRLPIFDALFNVKTNWHDVTYTLENGVSKPILVAGISTYYGSDTAALRIKNLSQDGFSVKVQEEQSRDMETAHYPEAVTFAMFSPGPIRNSSGSVIGVAGAVEAGQGFDRSAWHTVNLDRFFANPVIFASITTYNGAQPVVVRIQNINSGSDSSFNFRLDEWDYLDGAHLAESVSYVVLEAGVHTISTGDIATDNDAREWEIEVGLRKNSQGEGVGHGWTAIGQGEHTISQVLSANDPTVVTTRTRRINILNLQIKLQRQEASNFMHTPEDVGYMIIHEQLQLIGPMF